MENLLEYFFFITADNLLPVKSPILAHISWMTIIKGYWNGATQSILYPNCAPAWENVAIPDGSSSDALLLIQDLDFKKDLNGNHIKKI